MDEKHNQPDPPKLEPWLWTDIKRLIYDQGYAITSFRAATGFVGMLFVGGVIEVPDLSPERMWMSKLLGAVLAFCAWKWRAGDKTLHTLNESSNEQLHVVGVATTVATTHDVAVAQTQPGSVIDEPPMANSSTCEHVRVQPKDACP